ESPARGPHGLLRARRPPRRGPRAAGSAARRGSRAARLVASRRRPGEEGTVNAHAVHTAEVAGAGCCGGQCAPEAPRSTAARARGVLAGLAAALLAVGCVLDLASMSPGWTGPLFLGAVLAGAVFPARRAWDAVRRGSLDINALMVIAVAGAIVIGE